MRRVDKVVPRKQRYKAVPEKGFHDRYSEVTIGEHCVVTLEFTSYHVGSVLGDPKNTAEQIEDRMRNWGEGFKVREVIQTILALDGDDIPTKHIYIAED